MRAIVARGYGSPDILQLREVETPEPEPGEVLVKVRATTVTTGDWRARSLEMPPGFGPVARLVFGIRGPRQPILGTEMAGTVESVGAGVTSFAAGDEVFAFTGAAMGCHAEYRTIAADGAIAHRPANLTFDEAAPLSFGGTTALTFLRRAKVLRGDHVLIIGASGCVGTAAVQLARHYGADVTGVCSSANVELLASIGCHHVIDYTTTDFSGNGLKYDVVMDTTGTVTIARGVASLAPGGRLLLVSAGLADNLRGAWVSARGGAKVVTGPSTGHGEDLRFLGALAAAGEYLPVIDRRYAFEEIADAHRYVDTGRKRGNVVITMGS